MRKGQLPSGPCAKGHFAWYTEPTTGWAVCRECQRANGRRWRQSNPEKYLTLKRASRLRRTYELSLEDKERMWEEQVRRCAICLTEIPLQTTPIDHDHKTGRVRGLLCRNCNLFLGRLESENGLVEKCLKYLADH